MARWLAAPAPLARARGITPRMNAMEVMMIGRKRRRAASMEASRRQVDTDQFRSWIDGIIRYDAISLPALLRRLAREYDVKIELCTDAFDDKTFRISITEAQDIESIMGGLCDILPISVRRDTCGYRVDSRPRKTEP